MEDNNKHSELVKMYIDRNIKFQLDPKDTIIRAINKLGYKNKYDNLEDEIKEHLIIKHNLINPPDHIYDYFYNELKSSGDNNIVNTFNNKNKRYEELLPFIGTDNISEFYNTSTLSELEYIGY